MKMIIFSDPHIGLTRNNHTTPASRQALRQAVAQQARDIVDKDDFGLICLGDLFDSYDADAASLVEGFDIYTTCGLTLFGNHDLANRKDRMSAIEAVDRIYQAPVTRFEADVGRASSSRICGYRFWWVDHKFTQALFEEALNDAYENAYGPCSLLLHCNYDSGFAHQESTLNLTRDKAEWLLSRFEKIFIGHEHMSRTDFDGKLVLVGNTHPTSFSDVSDKFMWEVDVQPDQIASVTPVLIWLEADGYLNLHWSDLPELTTLPESVQFVEVVGDAEPEHMAAISKQVSDIWKLSDNLLMVKNGVQSSALQLTATPEQLARCESVPERISRDLEGTKLYAVWTEYLARL